MLVCIIGQCIVNFTTFDYRGWHCILLRIVQFCPFKKTPYKPCISYRAQRDPFSKESDLKDIHDIRKKLARRTLAVFVILLHVASGLFNALSSAQGLPLVDAVSWHRRVVVFRLVAVVLGAGTTVVSSWISVVEVLSKRRLRCGRCCGSAAGSSGARSSRRRTRAFLIVRGFIVVVILSKKTASNLIRESE